MNTNHDSYHFLNFIKVISIAPMERRWRIVWFFLCEITKCGKVESILRKSSLSDCSFYHAYLSGWLIYLSRILTGKDCMLLIFIVPLLPSWDTFHSTSNQCRPFERKGLEYMEDMRTWLYTSLFLENFVKFSSMGIKPYFTKTDKNMFILEKNVCSQKMGVRNSKYVYSRKMQIPFLENSSSFSILFAFFPP